MPRALLALGLVAAAVAPVLFWHLASPAWVSDATCMPDSCFCEQLRPGGVLQPANTWSSLGFVVVSAAIVLQAPRRRFVELFVAVAFLLGVTSAYYHASLSFAGQWLDVSSMYLLAALAGAHGAFAAGYLEKRTAIVVAVLASAGAIALSGIWPEARRFLFAALIGGLLVVEGLVAMRRPEVRRTLLIGTAIFLVSYAVWILDNQRIVCAPESLLQGHAIWHLGTATAALLLFRAHQKLA